MIKELRKELREAIALTLFNVSINSGEIMESDLKKIDALLPIIAKFAVSLCEVDEKKLENMLKATVDEHLNLDGWPQSGYKDLAHTLATSQIIKGR